MLVGMTSPIELLVRSVALTYAILLERVCEEALATGQYGVLVWWDVDGEPRAEVNMKVPFGTIYEHFGRHNTVPDITHIRV